MILIKEFIKQHPAIKPGVLAEEAGLNRQTMTRIMSASGWPYKEETAEALKPVLNRYGYPLWLRERDALQKCKDMIPHLEKYLEWDFAHQSAISKETLDAAQDEILRFELTEEELMQAVIAENKLNIKSNEVARRALQRALNQRIIDFDLEHKLKGAWISVNFLH